MSMRIGTVSPEALLLAYASSIMIFNKLLQSQKIQPTVCEKNELQFTLIGQMSYKMSNLPSIISKHFHAIIQWFPNCVLCIASIKISVIDRCIDIINRSIADTRRIAEKYVSCLLHRQMARYGVTLLVLNLRDFIN